MTHMTSKLVVQNAQAGTLMIAGQQFPEIIKEAGEDAIKRFLEFFTANIRNKNTREAYARAAVQFLEWCELHGFSLIEIE